MSDSRKMGVQACIISLIVVLAEMSSNTPIWPLAPMLVNRALEIFTFWWGQMTAVVCPHCTPIVFPSAKDRININIVESVIACSVAKCFGAILYQVTRACSIRSARFHSAS
jgi:hypothetical protein